MLSLNRFFLVVMYLTLFNVKAFFIVKLSFQNDPSWVDLQANLLTFESRLEQLNNSSGLNLNASTNFSSKTDPRSNKFGSRRNWRGSYFIDMMSDKSRGGMSKPACQVCNKIRHFIIQCFYCFVKTYTSMNLNSKKGKQRTSCVFIN